MELARNKSNRGKKGLTSKKKGLALKEKVFLDRREPSPDRGPAVASPPPRKKRSFFGEPPKSKKRGEGSSAEKDQCSTSVLWRKHDS